MRNKKSYHSKGKDFYMVGGMGHTSSVALGYSLSKKNKTAVVLANKNINKANEISKLIKTSYYFVETSDDLIGIEVCAAIKNFYSMIIGSANELNTAAFLLNKSIIEMNKFVKFLGGSEKSVYGLAGLGDLYVSSAGGRNSKMGQLLGKGHLYTEAKAKFMPKETIEGAELAMYQNLFLGRLKKFNEINNLP